MSRKIKFNETQRFNQWWVYALLLLINGFLWVVLSLHFMYDTSVGNNPASGTELLVIAGVVTVVSLFVLLIRLETEVSERGVSVRFFPIHFSKKCYSWNQITACAVRTYSPIKDYGGWGLRYSLTGKGKAYNIKGNQGLQLEVNGKKVLIGTQRGEELQHVLNEIKNPHQMNDEDF